MSGRLYHTASRIIAQALIGAGVGSAPPSAGFAGAASWPVYAPDEPNNPDSVITVTDTAGVVDGYSMVDGRVEEHYGIQVRVRGDTPDEARLKAEEIGHSLTHPGPGGVRLRVITLTDPSPTTSYCVHSVTRRGGVVGPMREPESERRVCTINAVACIEIFAQ